MRPVSRQYSIHIFVYARGYQIDELKPLASVRDLLSEIGQHFADGPAALPSGPAALFFLEASDALSHLSC